MLKKVYGNNVIKKAVYEWHKCFLERRTNIEDDFKLGIPPLPPQMKMVEVFFDYEGITHYEFKAKLLIKNFNWRFLNDYAMQSDENALKNG